MLRTLLGSLSDLLRRGWRNRADPSRDWIATEGYLARLDLKRHALCQVRLNDPVAWLEPLGRVDDPRAASFGELCYYSRGIWFSFEGDRIDAFGVHWSADGRYRPFSGEVVGGPRSLRVGPETTEAGFCAHFGTPYWRDQDPDEILLFYEFGDWEWQVEFSLEDRLSALIVVSPPLLADPKQRSAYGVTREWPPLR